LYIPGQIIVLGLISIPIAAGVIAERPIINTLRAGGSLFAHPVHLIIVVVISFPFALGVIGLIVDQRPRFVGVRYCDYFLKPEKTDYPEQSAGQLCFNRHYEKTSSHWMPHPDLCLRIPFRGHTSDSNTRAFFLPNLNAHADTLRSNSGQACYCFL
jgi:hypothetical protein